MSMVLKSSVTPPTVHTYRRRTHSLASWTTRTFETSGGSGQIVTSNHAPINTKVDDGGAFALVKAYNYWGMANYSGTIYDGPMTVGAPTGTWTPFSLVAQPDTTDNDLIVAGTKAVAQTEPTNPVSDMAVALGELRSGPASLPSVPGFSTIQGLRDRAHLARSAGSEYLNVEFGWKPLVSDLRDLSYAVDQSESIMRSYREGSDRKIRRRLDFPSDQRTEQATGWFAPKPTDTWTYSFPGSETRSTRSEMWFSGAFRYHVPVPDSQANKFAAWKSEARKLYGIRLDPEVLWNLAPWTWMTDWFLNTGDIMHNISAMGTDGLVMQYGYMMSEKEFRQSRIASLPGGGGSWTYVFKRCRRLPSSPYGFGVSNSSLTTRQVSILAALGLSR